MPELLDLAQRIASAAGKAEEIEAYVSWQHETEIRCYIRDPDGYLIEVGQTTLARGWRPPTSVRA